MPIAVYFYVALRRLGYPFELEWLEGGEVEIVNRVVHGQALYVAPTLHYVPYPYPPLFFWVSAVFAKVLGVGFLAPRLVSFVASLGVLALLWDIVRRETGDAVAGLVAAGLFAATYQASGAYFDLARVDSLFLLLLLAAIAVARRAQTWRGGAVVGLLVFLSFFTKQTALFAAAPLLVYLLFVRRRVGLPACLTLGGTARRLHRGARSGASTVGTTTTSSRSSRARGSTPTPLSTFIPKSLLRPTGWAGIWRWWGSRRAVRPAARPPGRPRGTSPSWPFWIAVGVGLVGASWLSLVHAGGSSDVLMPAYAAVAIFAGLGYTTLVRTDPRYQALLGAVLAVVIAVQVVQLDRGSLHEIPSAASDGGRTPLHRTGGVAPGAGDRGRPSLVRHHGRQAVVGPVRSGARRLAIRLCAARHDLQASIESTLTSPPVTTVFGDNRGDTLGPGFDRYFQLGPPVFTCTRCFFPVTDVPRRPYLRYDRR